MAEPRLAVHPLELSGVSLEEHAALKAQFEVMVARVSGVKLAGSARVEDALSKSAAERCELRDSCLRFLAEATDSLYGMYTRLETAPARAIVTARVVRSDGAVVRRVRIEAENARDALGLAITDLRLGALESTPPLSELPVSELTPPPLPQAEPLPPLLPPLVIAGQPGRDWKKVAGWSLVGVGGATLAAGGILAGLAANRANANRPDANGSVTPARAEGASTALRQSNIAAGLIPAGATLTVLGAILVLLPSSSEERVVSVRMAPINGGLAASVSGALP